MTELRQKMIRAMELKNLSPNTQRAYLAAVAFAAAGLLIKHLFNIPMVSEQNFPLIRVLLYFN